MFCYFVAELRMMSMGQGQEVHARRIMTQALSTGGWVMLQNCHLSLDYVLEAMDQILDSANIHPDFRLWVTTEIHPKFPITFLQVFFSLLNKIYYKTFSYEYCTTFAFLHKPTFYK